MTWGDLWYYSTDPTPAVAAGPKQEMVGRVGQQERPVAVATALFPFLCCLGAGPGLCPFCVPLP